MTKHAHRKNEPTKIRQVYAAGICDVHKQVSVSSALRRSSDIHIIQRSANAMLITRL